MFPCDYCVAAYEAKFDSEHQDMEEEVTCSQPEEWTSAFTQKETRG